MWALSDDFWVGREVQDVGRIGTALGKYWGRESLRNREGGMSGR